MNLFGGRKLVAPLMRAQQQKRLSSGHIRSLSLATGVPKGVQFRWKTHPELQMVPPF